MNLNQCGCKSLKHWAPVEFKTQGLVEIVILNSFQRYTITMQGRLEITAVIYIAHSPPRNSSSKCQVIQIGLRITIPKENFITPDTGILAVSKTKSRHLYNLLNL